jgi:hypothetical protein
MQDILALDCVLYAKQSILDVEILAVFRSIFVESVALVEGLVE